VQTTVRTLQRVDDATGHRLVIDFIAPDLERLKKAIVADNESGAFPIAAPMAALSVRTICPLRPMRKTARPISGVGGRHCRTGDHRVVQGLESRNELLQVPGVDLGHLLVRLLVLHRAHRLNCRMLSQTIYSSRSFHSQLLGKAWRSEFCIARHWSAACSISIMARSR